jgi:hypothetical protein
LRAILIATDGKVKKKILWFSVTSNSVCSGYCWKNRDFHLTYHFDGNTFITFPNGISKKTVTLPSLKNLDNFHQLYTTSIPLNFSSVKNRPTYNLEKFDAVINVDTRIHKKGIGVSFYIIPENRSDLLSKVLLTPTKIEAHYFFNCNPWIGIVLYGVIYHKEEKPQ